MTYRDFAAKLGVAVEEALERGLEEDVSSARCHGENPAFGAP